MLARCFCSKRTVHMEREIESAIAPLDWEGKQRR